jgi:hypothetical protein
MNDFRFSRLVVTIAMGDLHQQSTSRNLNSLETIFFSDSPFTL